MDLVRGHLSPNNPVHPQIQLLIMRHANINITRKYYDKSNDNRALEALNTIDEMISETPEDRINKYREQIKELEDKIRIEEGLVIKKGA